MGALNEERLLANPDVQTIRETASSVAHGLNNLLAAVAGLSAQLADAAPAGRDGLPTEELRLIHQAALDGLALSRRLLHLSRGEPVLGPSSVDLVDMARAVLDAVDLTRPRWHDQPGQCGVAIESVVEVEQPLLVLGVASDLREIVVNLIHNAVDAMPHGGRLCVRGARDDGSVIVSCQDSGLGIPPEVLQRVFEPFFTTKGERGTGLGLAIVRSVVGRHGGEARVTSEVGVGTTVTLRLPAAEAMHTTVTPPWQPAQPPGTASWQPAHSYLCSTDQQAAIPDVALAGATNGSHGSNGHLAAWRERSRRVSLERDATAGRARAAARAAAADDLAASLATCTVLVVEDDPIFRAVFTRRLTLDARRVTAVGDAASALAMLEAACCDVLCVDDGLPDRPGRELAAEIRRRGLPCAVILVTGTATAPDDPSLAGPGVDAILPKPCTDAELARAVRVARARQAERSSAPA